VLKMVVIASVAVPVSVIPPRAARAEPPGELL
jgi:hypothetical protein